ncbi:hypothetical protein M3084_10375, partial [Succinatimonas hippei]|uniref:hypothetical protein n=1 Tax=Succinatimonas hippei TaxID=626938 RepID=UPI0020115FBB
IFKTTSPSPFILRSLLTILLIVNVVPLFTVISIPDKLFVVSSPPRPLDDPSIIVFLSAIVILFS